MLQNAYMRKMIIGIVLEERLRAGSRAALRQTKTKAFGTVLATAPSPTFYKAAKKPLGHLGGFFAA